MHARFTIAFCVGYFLQRDESLVERRTLIAEQDLEFEKSLITDSEKVCLPIDLDFFTFASSMHPPRSSYSA